MEIRDFIDTILETKSLDQAWNLLYKNEVNAVLSTCENKDFWYNVMNPLCKDLDSFKKDISIEFNDQGQFITLENGIQLYLGYNDIEKNLWNIAMSIREQSGQSSHKYIIDGFLKINENTNIIDIGAETGSFGFTNLDKVKSVRFFESESEWINTLDKTKIQNKLSDRVTIHQEYVNSHSKINELYEINDTDNFYIKIDVEGAEMEVLSGLQELFERDNDIYISCCAYHKDTHENEIIQFLISKGFKIELSGYLIPFWDLRYPYFRRGMIYAKKLK